MSPLLSGCVNLFTYYSCLQHRFYYYSVMVTAGSAGNKICHSVIFALQRHYCYLLLQPIEHENKSAELLFVPCIITVNFKAAFASSYCLQRIKVVRRWISLTLSQDVRGADFDKILGVDTLKEAYRLIPLLTLVISHWTLSLNGVSNEKFGGSKVYPNIRYGSGTMVIDVYFSFEPAVFP
jgi:hypothetical protein